MPKLTDDDYYPSLISSALKTFKTQYIDNYDHNYALYNSKESPRCPDIPSQQQNINLVYPMIESERAAVGFKFPKITTKAKRPFFFIRHVKGNPNLEKVNPEDYSEVYNRMIKEKIYILPNQMESGESVDYFLLDGTKSARTAEGALSWFIGEKNVETEFDKCMQDAFISKVGCVWIDYYDDYYLSTSDSEFIKKNDVTLECVKAGEDVLWDTKSIKNISDIHKCKWVARSIKVSYNDLEALKNIKRPDTGKPLFKSEIIQDLINKRNPETKTVSNDEKKTESNSLDNPNGVVDLENDDRENCVKFWKVLLKPTLAERLDPKSKFPRGKIVYIVEGISKIASDFIPWTVKTDEYPLYVLYFNAPQSTLFPVSDIEIYEPLLVEYNLYKALQRSLADLSSRIKAILNSENWNQTNIDDVMLKLSDTATRFIKIPGFKPEHIFQFVQGNQNSPLWTIDSKVWDNIQKTSLTAETAMGVARPYVSATTAASSDKFMTMHTQMRQYLYIKFAKSCLDHVLCLMAQYYTTKRMIQINGDTQPEWIEFGRENIQGEYNIYLDLLSMNPNDSSFKIAQVKDILTQFAGVFNTPSGIPYLKILSEGRMINFSEMFMELLKFMDIGNERIFPQVPTDVIEAATQLLTQKLMVMQPNTSSSNQSVPDSNTVPPVSSGKIPPDGSTQQGTVGGPVIEDGTIMPNGGPPKLSPEETQQFTQYNK